MILAQGSPGQTYQVEQMPLPEAVKHRLEAIGMTIGTHLLVLGRKNQGTLILKVRGTRFAVGRGITSRIEVS